MEQILPEKPTGLQLVWEFPIFHRKGPLLCSSEPTTPPCSQPDITFGLLHVKICNKHGLQILCDI